MDPISITGLVMDVGHILASLIQYAKTVQGAKSEMRKLSEELFALKGILEHLASQSPDDEKSSRESQSGQFDRGMMAKVLYTTQDFVRRLLADLETPATKFKRLKQKFEWPFTQEQVNAHLTQLEWVKSWLILVLMADHTSGDRDLQREMSALTSSLQEDLRIRNQERSQMAHKELFKWIAPAKSIGTGKWFIDGYLKRWLHDWRDDNRILFLVGKTGTGKTTLFAQTVNELISIPSHDANLSLAYFYCTISDAASQTPENILGSIVAQLSGSNDSILKGIRSIYDERPKNQAHRLPIQIRALEDAILQFGRESRAIILLDAVNESQDLEAIQRSLLRLVDESKNIRVLVTTTTTTLSPKRHHVSALNISTKMMRADIETFIQHRLERDDTLRNLTPKFKAEIEDTLLRNADGSFRWVQLSLDNLNAQRTARSMRSALNNLPVTLRETYVQTLERIAPDDRELVRNALFWICFAKEPLTLTSLNEVVVLDESSTTLDEDMMLVPPHILLHICQGLITRGRTQYLSLAHASIKEFLTSEWIRSSRVSYFSLDPTTADATMMHKCLSYLCLDNFKGGYLHAYEEPWRYLETHPFLDYAAHSWAVHGAACGFQRSKRGLSKSFFATRHLPRCGNYGVWVQTLLPGADTRVIQTTHPLYYAASFGMLRVVKALLASDPDIDIDQRGGRVGATPLFAAAWRYNFEVVEVLLQAGADPTIIDPGTGISVLGLAKKSQFAVLQPIVARWGEQRGKKI
ncbi:hypothetical protein N7492_006491 [Penicillium capsulatum]|uniref:AAA+ ATPase domain-containing protein n=1 Tax=Penicillium capsulatum TaxID=69766 RepID=A0A9W9HY28_9EURO|nr:hypothetical protein N7492_006491 [Penicillium capsulatum]KAJ6116330.1 hypothetical protein N7512_006055 [Penicillium capsulatum]